MAEIKRMSVAEFRGAGYLQEVNRCFLHPLGLALEVVGEPCGCHDGNVEAGPAGATYTVACPACNGSAVRERFGQVWDYRDDPKGVVFGDGMIDANKAQTIATSKKVHSRHAAFGWVVQPIELTDQ